MPSTKPLRFITAKYILTLAALLLAPRPFLALTGDMDYGSPVDGIRVLEEKASRVYRAVGAPDRFKSIVYRDTGHVYTPEMRAERLAWFERWLKPGHAK